jgi:hypothetical protein
MSCLLVSCTACHTGVKVTGVCCCDEMCSCLSLAVTGLLVCICASVRVFGCVCVCVEVLCLAPVACYLVDKVSAAVWFAHTIPRTALRSVHCMSLS